MTRNMSDKITNPVNATEKPNQMAGSAKKPVLIGLLALASAFMAYRLIFPPGGGGIGSGDGSASSPADGLMHVPPGQTRGGNDDSEAGISVDPSLRLDLLSNSRAVSYRGSKRNIFVIGPVASAGTAGTSNVNGTTKSGTGTGTQLGHDIEKPVMPPPRPPVVIPLKFYGIAERSGGVITKALLTSGDSILIAQVGQTVAQNFKIVRIGLNKLELEDIRDHSSHEIPLEDASTAAKTAPPAGEKE
jgi:hypothetical protein